MNTEDMRKLKTMIKITRKSAKIPIVQVVAVTIVYTGNGYSRVPFSPTVDVVLKSGNGGS